jgi:Na+-translocating ferredoxin:NAD+ oxidoreductase RnfA subunit
MSVFGLAFYFVFGGNVLLGWGLVPVRRVDRKESPWAVAGFIAASAIAAALDGLLFRYALMPWGLESIAPIVFTLFLFGAYALLNAALSVLGKPLLDMSDGKGFQATLVLYAAAMIAGDSFSSIWYLLGGGAAAAFGYLAATRFLDTIMDRLDLEPVPLAFRGDPIRLLSAGLMALAFGGVDAGFFARIMG